MNKIISTLYDKVHDVNKSLNEHIVNILFYIKFIKDSSDESSGLLSNTKDYQKYIIDMSDRYKYQFIRLFLAH